MQILRFAAETLETGIAVKPGRIPHISRLQLFGKFSIFGAVKVHPGRQATPVWDMRIDYLPLFGTIADDFKHMNAFGSAPFQGLCQQ